MPARLPSLDDPRLTGWGGLAEQPHNFDLQEDGRTVMQACPQNLDRPFRRVWPSAFTLTSECFDASSPARHGACAPPEAKPVLLCWLGA